MSEWTILESKAILDVKVRMLRRKCRGHYFSNYIWFSEAIAKQFSFSRFFYCEEGDNMLVLQKYDRFDKLFYFLGDVDNSKMTPPKDSHSSQILCEMFEEEGKEKQSIVLDKLCSQGFSIYRKFYMWECNKSENISLQHTDKDGKKITYGEDLSREQLKTLFKSFDPIVDLMPLPELFEDYYNSKHFLTCYVENQLAGIVVYTIKDSVVDEDLIYVFPEFRGIGSILYKAFKDKVFNELNCKKIVPWVHTDNSRSIAFHTKVGAVQTPYYKLSLLTK